MNPRKKCDKVWKRCVILLKSRIYKCDHTWSHFIKVCVIHTFKSHMFTLLITLLRSVIWNVKKCDFKVWITLLIKKSHLWSHMWSHVCFAWDRYIFSPQIERKRSEEYLVINLAVERKLWAIFLPRVHLWKKQTPGGRLKT